MDATDLARRLLDPVPVHRTFGLRVLRAGDGQGEVAIETTEPLSNVVGSLHASGLATLVDAAALAAMIGTCRSPEEFDGVLPLGSRATLSFLAPARGVMVGRCQLGDEARKALLTVLDHAADRARFETRTVVSDERGAVVCEGTFSWSVRRPG